MKRNAEKTYKLWVKRRDEIEYKKGGMYSLVKMVCDKCGYKWTEHVVFTLPPCPKCGSKQTYEYETLSAS